MKLYLDTSTDTCVLRLDGQLYLWESGHQLAEHLHKFIFDKLSAQAQNSTEAAQSGGAENPWLLLDEITFMSGPGSFTGLRIGAAVVNSLADQLKIPLYAVDETTGKSIRENGFDKTLNDNNLKRKQLPVIIPNYGRPARITSPKK